jgi:hypothetical protein
MSIKTTAPLAAKTNGSAAPVKQLPAAPETPTSRTESREPQPKAKEPAGDLPPLDDRLHRLNQLFDLQSKYNRLAKSQQKLSEFKMKKGSENISLTLRDDDSRSSESFSTSNPDVIKAVLECLQTTIVAKRKELEPQLKW